MPVTACRESHMRNKTCLMLAFGQDRPSIAAAPAIWAWMSSSPRTSRTVGSGFAVQVKTYKSTVRTGGVATVAGFGLAGNYDRWLFPVENRVRQGGAPVRHEAQRLRIELLSPDDLRHWAHKFTYSKTNRRVPAGVAPSDSDEGSR